MIRLYFKKIIIKLITIYSNYSDVVYFKNKNLPLIISNNCWGSEFYKNLGVEYPTPFVGVFLYPKDYVNLIKVIDDLDVNKFEFTDNGNYFIGTFKGIDFHFLHYTSLSEINHKFKRRLERFNSLKNERDIIVKLCDVDNATFEDFYYLSKEIINKNGNYHFLLLSNRLKSQFVTQLDGWFYNNMPNGYELFKTRKLYLNWNKFCE
ncbi:hypothetical protein VCHA37P199_130175 [Vibrio chagasii]|nr:hypothetical protein VCHA37P199_130175 [Vibrio chagasii]